MKNVKHDCATATARIGIGILEIWATRVSRSLECRLSKQWVNKYFGGSRGKNAFFRKFDLTSTTLNLKSETCKRALCERVVNKT